MKRTMMRAGILSALSLSLSAVSTGCGPTPTANTDAGAAAPDAGTDPVDAGDAGADPVDAGDAGTETDGGLDAGDAGSMMPTDSGPDGGDMMPVDGGPDAGDAGDMTPTDGGPDGGDMMPIDGGLVVMPDAGMDAGVDALNPMIQRSGDAFRGFPLSFDVDFNNPSGQGVYFTWTVTPPADCDFEVTSTGFPNGQLFTMVPNCAGDYVVHLSTSRHTDGSMAQTHEDTITVVDPLHLASLTANDGNRGDTSTIEAQIDASSIPSAHVDSVEFVAAVTNDGAPVGIVGAGDSAWSLALSTPHAAYTAEVFARIQYAHGGAIRTVEGPRQTVEFSTLNTAPTIDALAFTDGPLTTAGGTLELRGTTSDHDDDDVTCTFVVEAGPTPVPTAVLQAGEACTFDVTFPDSTPGPWSLGIDATDGHGGSVMHRLNMHPTDVPPSLDTVNGNNTVGYTCSAGTCVADTTVTLLGSDFDGSDLTYTVVVDDMAPEHQPAAGANVVITEDGDGVFDVAVQRSTGGPMVGTYALRATVTDEDGNSDTAQFVLTVTNVAPALTLNVPIAATHTYSADRYRIAVNLASSVTDPEGNAVTSTFELTDCPIKQNTMDDCPSIPANGVFSDDRSNIEDLVGTYTVRLHATDAEGAESMQTRQFTVTNTSPVLRGTAWNAPIAHTYSGRYNATFTLPESPASDADGDPLTITPLWTCDGNVVTIDESGLECGDVDINYNVANETISLSADALADLLGSHTFGLRVTDDLATATNNALVQLNVQNTRPAIIAALPAQNVQHTYSGSSYVTTYTLPNAPVSDMNGDPLMVTPRWECDGAMLTGDSVTCDGTVWAYNHNTRAVTVTSSRANADSHHNVVRLGFTASDTVLSATRDDVLVLTPQDTPPSVEVVGAAISERNHTSTVDPDDRDDDTIRIDGTPFSVVLRVADANGDPIAFTTADSMFFDTTGGLNAEVVPTGGSTDRTVTWTQTVLRRHAKSGSNMVDNVLTFTGTDDFGHTLSAGATGRFLDRPAQLDQAPTFVGGDETLISVDNNRRRKGGAVYQVLFPTGWYNTYPSVDVSVSYGVSDPDGDPVHVSMAKPTCVGLTVSGSAISSAPAETSATFSLPGEHRGTCTSDTPIEFLGRQTTNVGYASWNALTVRDSCTLTLPGGGCGRWTYKSVCELPSFTLHDWRDGDISPDSLPTTDVRFAYDQGTSISCSNFR